jgi:hypothetical protein
MSHRETISLAHTAQCKLQLAADKPDRNLRFILGHALTLDSLNLRLIQIEEESRIVQKPSHSSSVKFKETGQVGVGHSPLSGRRKSPPPNTGGSVSHRIDEDDNEEYGDEDLGSEHGELSLTRFPSGTAQPPRYPKKEQSPPRVDHYSESSSSDDRELETLLELIQRNLNHESLEKITKNDTDKSLAALYKSVQKCPCHKTDAPELENFWELHSDQEFGEVKGFDGVRFAIAEISVEVA